MSTSDKTRESVLRVLMDKPTSWMREQIKTHGGKVVPQSWCRLCRSTASSEARKIKKNEPAVQAKGEARTCWTTRS